jgi:hypothetical protein
MARTMIQPRRMRRMIAIRSGLVATLMVACMIVTACGTSTPPPSAATLLARAASAFDQMTSFHFALTAQHLGDSDPLPVTQATGDVQRPDKLTATATVTTAIGPVQVKLIIIGQQEWITNPLTGLFQPTTGYAGLLAIFNAQQGVGAALTQLQQPSTSQSSSAAAGDCWKIKGTLPASAVAAAVNGATAGNSSVATTVCVGQKDNELYSVTLAGQVSQTDTADTVRVFTLTQFNQPVTIAAPSVTPSLTPTA